jgi:hypothetical protein
MNPVFDKVYAPPRFSGVLPSRKKQEKIMDTFKYNKYKKIFLENNGILRLLKAEKLGIPQHIIYEMLNAKILIRESKGLYRLADMEPLSNPDLIQVSLLVPKSIICLIS